jgi:hypothetical protein
MSWLQSRHPIVISAELAEHVGLNEAIVLQQLNYWIEGTGSGIEHDGRRWVYNTQPKWQEQFPFWSVDTVKRTFTSLQKNGLILVRQLAKAKHDRTNYYAINHERLNEIQSQVVDFSHKCKMPSSISADSANRAGQDALLDEGKMPLSIGAECPNVHTEITTENTTETITAEAGASAGSVVAVVADPKPPVVIESGGKQFEIPAELRYPGPSTKSYKTWTNYAVCYQRKHGAWPVWNKTIAALVTKFIDRVGIDVAPKVAAFYVVKVNDTLVTKSAHSFKLLLSEAEKYHTQYLTGRTVTSTQAQQIDKTQTNMNTADELEEQIRARHAQRASQ